MMKYSVERCVENDIEVLGIYETKEEMLAAKAQFESQYNGQPGVINGVYADMDENGNVIPAMVNGQPQYFRKLF